MRNGGVVAHATETCYGLACDLTNPEAVAKLFAIKQRPETMPVSALFRSIEQSEQYLEWNDIARDLAHKHLPGPLTIILKERSNTPHPLYVTPITNHQSLITIGLRISPNPTAQKLVEQFASPLSTTSANIHGKPNPYSIEDLKAQFTDQDLRPDLILDDGKLDGAAASTVVDVSDGTINILRQGDIVIE